MERIFKIKTKTNRIPQSQYPSERRYSASIVIGLSVVFLQLCFYSILMGTLIIRKMTLHSTSNITFNQNETTLSISFSTNSSDNIQNLVPNTNNTHKDEINIYDMVEKDSNIILQQNAQTSINTPTLMCSGSFLMAAGFALSFGTGAMAWKRWYIDHNITLFFVSSTFSTITASVGLLLSLLTCINSNFDYDMNRVSPITFSLTINIIILSSIGVIWSFLAAKVAYVGMKSLYPDDIILSNGRHVEVSTVKKGNGRCCAFPPDLIEHFPSGDKLAKYLPKKENGDLPKAESTLEYRQRFDRFLSEVPESSVDKSCQ